jgi:hypothetical protein
MEQLSLSHRSAIEAALSKFPPLTSELTFPSLFAWRKSRSMFVIDIDGSLVLILKREGAYTLFGPPIGPMPISEAFDAANRIAGEPVIACERIPETIASATDAKCTDLFEDRGNFDYVYRCEDLAGLAGRKYHKKRNLVTQCLEDYDCSYEDLSPTLVPEIKDMQDRWCAERNCEKKPGLCKEYQAIMELLDNEEQLDLLGGAIRIDGTIQAYAIGSRLNSNTAVEHFEKAMSSFKGLYQLMNQWFCQRAMAEYEFVNREQDVGSPGLRQAKESYYPDHMIKKFVALHDIDRDEYERLKLKESRCE